MCQSSSQFLNCIFEIASCYKRRRRLWSLTSYARYQNQYLYNLVDLSDSFHNRMPTVCAALHHAKLNSSTGHQQECDRQTVIDSNTCTGHQNRNRPHVFDFEWHRLTLIPAVTYPVNYGMGLLIHSKTTRVVRLFRSSIGINDLTHTLLVCHYLSMQGLWRQYMLAKWNVGYNAQ